MKKIAPLLALVIAGVIVLIVTVGGGSAKKGSSAKSPSTSVYGSTAASGGSAPAANATLGSARTSLGTFLVDGKGRTLYLFEADKPSMSNCSGSCASIWPPLTAKGKPHVKGGVMASKVSVITGSGGNPQVAYNGHPRYYYAGDAKPGATEGQGLNQFGAKWYVVAPSGSKIDND